MRTISDSIAAIALAVLIFAGKPAIAEIEVLACEPEWASLARTLGGDRVRIASATTAFQDPHHIEARPSLIVKARRADVLFCTGAELEIGWLPLLLRKSGNPRIQPGRPGHFMASQSVELIEQAPEADRSHGDVHAAGNPHLHWDPHRVLQVAADFSETMRQVDPEFSAHYSLALKRFEHQWRAAIARWESRTAPLDGAEVFVQHKNWSYLLNWIGVQTRADLEPKPGIPPTSAHLSELLQRAREQPPRAILIANYQDRKGADWLSGKSGVPVQSLPFTVGGAPAAADLEGLYDVVIDALAESLTP